MGQEEEEEASPREWSRRGVSGGGGKTGEKGERERDGFGINIGRECVCYCLFAVSVLSLSACVR